MATATTEAVSVRVEPHIKASMQAAAEREMRSVANMLEVMVVTYCRNQGYPLVGVPEETLCNVVRNGTAWPLISPSTRKCRAGERRTTISELLTARGFETGSLVICGLRLECSAVLVGLVSLRV